MVQPQAHEFLNQKELDSAMRDGSREPHGMIEASSRLAQALDRLEKGIERRPGLDRAGDTQLVEQLRHENEQLIEEEQRLQEMLMNLQQENESLRHVASHVHEKLDDTVSRLTLLIEETP